MRGGDGNLRKRWQHHRVHSWRCFCLVSWRSWVRLVTCRRAFAVAHDREPTFVQPPSSSAPSTTSRSPLTPSATPPAASSWAPRSSLSPGSSATAEVCPLHGLPSAAPMPQRIIFVRSGRTPHAPQGESHAARLASAAAPSRRGRGHSYRSRWRRRRRLAGGACGGRPRRRCLSRGPETSTRR